MDPIQGVSLLGIIMILVIVGLNIAIFVKVWIATTKVGEIEKYLHHWYLKGVPTRKVGEDAVLPTDPPPPNGTWVPKSGYSRK